ncbi:hypothetical protein [Flavobacterium zhairuonense]|uniref:hypothetical protein n=1 Tax=Flavobacterium zhairuonense TaxID=2493631 RepID=UPI001F1FE400|nr:hypothetical protein [Flavobacterium zhairuonense]
MTKIILVNNIYNVFLPSKTTKHTLKRLFVIFLSCMLLVPSFGSFFVYTSFKLNQEEISKTICVQRKLVFNTCNGRCELQKSLKKYADNEKRMQNNLKEKAEVVYIQSSILNNFKFTGVIESKAKIYASFEKKPIAIANSIFHPPSYFI